MTFVKNKITHLGEWCREYTPEILIMAPALSIIGYWIAGEVALLSIATFICSFLLIMNNLHKITLSKTINRNLSGRNLIISQADHIMQNLINKEMTVACFIVSLDNDKKLASYGNYAYDLIYQKTAERLTKVAREGDIVTPLDQKSFAVLFGPIRSIDIETGVQISTRLQAVASSIIEVQGIKVFPSVSIGFCLGNQAASRYGSTLFSSAQAALEEAKRNGPGAIRAHHLDAPSQTYTMPEPTPKENDAFAIKEAISKEQITPWFQPQLHALTGEVVAFEALARWHHPERGMILPKDFLKPIIDNNLSEKFYETILHSSLFALKSWDRAATNVGKVAINFSEAEFRNSNLVEKLKWELDRFNIAPNRLIVEVLETVVAQNNNDIIIRNLAEISDMGCSIDLDDFKVEHVALANIKRFSVDRIKIDRSLVKHIDADPQKREMVAAVISMAESLNVQTIGEGAETPEEYGTLTELGCGYIQGHIIAKPMSLSRTITWVKKYQEDKKRITLLEKTSGGFQERSVS